MAFAQSATKLLACLTLFCSAALAQGWAGDFSVETGTGTTTVSVDAVTGSVHVNGNYVGPCYIIGSDIFWVIGERYYCLQGAFPSEPGASGKYSEYPPLSTGSWKNVEL